MIFADAIKIFSMSFGYRALLVGGLVSLCAALLGVILVLKNYSLIGHGLADVGFASLTLAMALDAAPLAVAIPIVVAASFLIMYVSQNEGVNGDAAIGMFATGSLAVGVIINQTFKGFNADAGSYMFGSLLSVTREDVYFSIGLSVLIIALFAIFYNRLFLVTIDETFAVASGINVTLYRFLISFLTALTVVIGMRMMGTLLISSLIIFPAMTARRLVKSFRALVIASAIVSLGCFFAGMLMSVQFNLPTGASIVVANIGLMLIVSVIRS